MLQQDKNCERQFFNSLALSGHYETVSGDLYAHIFAALRENNVIVKGRMLEAGCGCGVFGKRFLKEFPDLEVVGVDIAGQMVKRANNGTPDYEAVVGDLELEDTFAANSFDVILCPFILHHFPDVKDVFSNFGVWLKKESIIIIVEPNGSNIINKVSGYLRKLVELAVGQDFVMERRLATPNETCHSVREYRRMLLRNNFTVIYVGTTHFPTKGLKPFSVRWIRDALYGITKALFPSSIFFGSDVLLIARRR